MLNIYVEDDGGPQEKCKYFSMHHTYTVFHGESIYIYLRVTVTRDRAGSR